MKLKLKMSRKQITVLVLVVLALGALLWGRAHRDEPGAGDGGSAGGTLDEAGRRACTDFIGNYRNAKSKAQRLSLADRVINNSGKTDNDGVREAASDVGISASDGGETYKVKADALIRACRQAGWTVA